MNKRKLFVSILLIVGLLSITLGVTVAFFNYTRTGNENVLAVGRIYFNSSQGTSINLTNVFPVKSTELENNSNVSSVTLTITGDTTYDEGLEYLVSADGVVNTVNSKQVPIGTSVTVSNLGTSDDSYFTNRGGNSSLYKILSKGNIKEDGELVVGYITKGATGVNGIVTVSAWLDGDKIAITDTQEENSEWQQEREVFSTTEWNSLQSSGVSFKLRVEANEGIWVEGPLTSYGQIIKEVNSTTQINFANASSSTNGQGLYILPGTENDTNPIYYYRGAVTNNNVIFGGYCWQMVRTTDTGGIKMIYNGIPDIEGSGGNTTYNCGTTRSIQNIMTTTTVLSSSTGYYYSDDYEVVSTSGNNATYRLKSKNNPITQVAIADATDASTSIPTIAANYPYTCKSTSSTGTCTELFKVDSYAFTTVANVYSSRYKSLIGRSVISSNAQSVSDVGYMSNTRYPYKNTYAATNSVYGRNVEWHTDHYLVIEDIENTASTNTTIDNNHHYSCGTATNNVGDAECAKVRYYYYNNYFIELENGDLLEDALYKMTGNGSQATKVKNAGYNLNVNDSAIKGAIDTWFRSNLTNEADNTKKDYGQYLEDTIFCNDRSYQTTGSGAYTNSGWNPNGGDLTKYLYFGTNNRFNNSWYSTSNVPSMTCPNETDRFTVSNVNGNGALTYPVGLITADEIILAGVGGNNANTSTYYLYTSDYYWPMTPHSFRYTNAIEFLFSNGLWDDNAVYNSYGIRPVVSLKPGIEFEEDGDGTPTNPYVVKYN